MKEILEVLIIAVSAFNLGYWLGTKESIKILEKLKKRLEQTKMGGDNYHVPLVLANSLHDAIMNMQKKIHMEQDNGIPRYPSMVRESSRRP